MKQLFTLLFFCISCTVLAQSNYWVSFKDKSASVFSIASPEAFMSKNALARRQKFQIPIHQTDLPVCHSYLKQLKNLDLELKNTSKWLNGALISISDENIISEIEKLPFIHQVKRLTFETPAHFKKKFQEDNTVFSKSTNNFDYALATNQIDMLEGQFLHNLDFTGSSIDIAVMDNGFPAVDSNVFFQEALLEGRIKAGYNFVADNDSVFISSNGNHGSKVISTMVSSKSGKLVGTAPDASYFLYCTEDNANEGLQEQYNWALAAEMADDSLGTNAIITTSLGYSNGFNDPSDNHVYADMDGNTTPITKAADLAASKGLLVINSAGNEGDKTWKYITAPADGDSVLCIGAVKADESIAVFSSRGPSANGKLKPNVCAQGSPAYGVSTSGNVTSINGTSFSCPILAGMAACLWQAYPEKSNMDIFYAIEKSAHLYSSPNYDFGYGIPNFKIAYDLLSNKFEKEFLIYPNPVLGNIQFYVPEKWKGNKIEIRISKINGEIVLEKTLEANLKTELVRLSNTLAVGTYYILLRSGKEKIKSKFVKI